MTSLFFKTLFDKFYVEVSLNPANGHGSDTDIICCVDHSGSMAGDPIRNVCEALKAIYLKTHIEYPLMCYGTTVKCMTVKDLENNEIRCSEGTDFSVIFNAI